MNNASGRRNPVSGGRGREALDVAVATGETAASGIAGRGDDPMPAEDGVVAETVREAVSGT